MLVMRMGKLHLLLGCRAVNTVLPLSESNCLVDRVNLSSPFLHSYRSQKQNLPSLKTIKLAFKMVLLVTTQMNVLITQ